MSGIRLTDKKFSPSLTIVKLTPFMVILHLGIMYFEKLVSKLTKIIRESSLFLSSWEIFHTVSICHETICPSSLSHTFTHLSTLKKSPTFFSQKLVTLKVSCIAKKLYFSALQ